MTGVQTCALPICLLFVMWRGGDLHMYAFANIQWTSGIFVPLRLDPGEDEVSNQKQSLASGLEPMLLRLQVRTLNH